MGWETIRYCVGQKKEGLKNIKWTALYFPVKDSTDTNAKSLTSVFGMGTGVTKSLWPSEIREILRFLRVSVENF